MPPLLNLSAPVGEGLDNLGDDVAAVNDALSTIGERDDEDLDIGDGAFKSLLTPSLSRSIEKHQEASDLRVDGHLNPGGPTEQSINNRLLGKPAGAGLIGGRPLRLAGGVGNDRENREDDVVAVKKALGGLGLMAEDPFDRPHPFIDLPTTAGIRAFQRAKKLKEDGALEPGGETEAALRTAVGNLARSFGPEWRAFQKRKAAAEAVVAANVAGPSGARARATLAAQHRPSPRTTARPGLLTVAEKTPTQNPPGGDLRVVPPGSVITDRPPQKKRDKAGRIIPWFRIDPRRRFLYLADPETGKPLLAPDGKPYEYSRKRIDELMRLRRGMPMDKFVLLAPEIRARWREHFRIMFDHFLRRDRQTPNPKIKKKEKGPAVAIPPKKPRKDKSGDKKDDDSPSGDGPDRERPPGVPPIFPPTAPQETEKEKRKPRIPTPGKRPIPGRPRRRKKR